jgi:hypothetical protein
MVKPRLSSRLAAICFAAILLQLALGTALGGTTHPARYGRPFCGVAIEPVTLGETTSIVRAGRCFATFAEEVGYLSHGRLRLPAGASADQFSLGQLNASIQGVTIIGRDYEDPNYSCNVFGPCLDWTVDNDFGCTGGRNYVAASMPVVGGFNWNNQVSSTKAFAGCSTNQNFENTNYGGALLNCLPNCAGMGVMNDATSSKQWRDL